MAKRHTVVNNQTKGDVMLRSVKDWIANKLPTIERRIVYKHIATLFAITTCISAVVFITHNMVVKHYDFDMGVKLTENEYHCLVENIYYEAGNQPMTGKIAVGYVTINRLFHTNFPSNVCKVVYEKTKACQFSWTCMTRPKVNHDHWIESENAAKFIAEKYSPAHDPTGGALYFHANYVKPRWTNVKKTVTIEDHIFYK